MHRDGGLLRGTLDRCTALHRLERSGWLASNCPGVLSERLGTTRRPGALLY
jgi:hypothetical protein